MIEEGLEYISKYMENIISERNDNKPCINIIKHNNILNFSENDFNEIKIGSYINKFYHQYQNSDMMEAYEPFLGIMGKIIKEEKVNIGQLLNKIEVYSLHKSIFENYFHKGICERDDEPILSEIDFEKDRFIKAIVDMLVELSNIRPILIVLNKINQICDSSLDVLNLLTNIDDSNIFVLGISNELGNINSYIKDKYQNFRQFCDIKDLVMDWPFYLAEKNMEIEYSFSFKNKNIDMYLNKVNNMFYTFAYDQALYYLNIFYQKIELEKLKVEPKSKLEMFILFIKTCIYKENYSYALLLCDSLKQIDSKKIHKRKSYMYYYFVATANMYNGNEYEAKSHAYECMKYADNQKEEFLTELLLNMCELSGWKDIWFCDKQIEVSEKLIDGCIKFKFLNHLAHIYVYCFDNDENLYKEVEGIEKRTPNVTKGINIAKKLKNEQFLLEAYRKNVMISSYSGQFHSANYFYNKSIVVAKRNNNKIEEANIYNGLGYNCCTSDLFKEANEYYNKALKIFYDNNFSDYIVETLYNMGMNAILAGDFKNASQYLIAVNNILKQLKRNSLRVCNISKIFGLIALSAFREERYYTAQFYANKARQFLEYILDYEKQDFYCYLWDDDIFLYYQVSALLKEREGKFNEAFECYDKAKIFMERSQGSKFFSYTNYAYDLSRLYRRLSHNNKAEELLCEARDYFNNQNNKHKSEIFEGLLKYSNWTIEYNEMPLLYVTMEEINEKIKIETIKEEAKEKKNDIRFFAAFQELINHNYQNAQDEIDTLMINFKNNYNMDNVIYISCEGNTPIIKFSDLEYKITSAEIKTIVRYFKKNPTGFALSKFSNNYHEYEDILTIFKKSKIFSIVSAPIYKNEKLNSIFIAFVKIQENWNSAIDREVMDDEDLEIYQFIFRLIVDAVEKYKLNDKLKKQAVTDELTGLLNRKGYYSEIDRLLLESSKQEKDSKLSILYADLDHFKYYNDTFGHHVGDELLIEFAKIFQASCGKLGTVVRFGGDEFVMLVNSTDRVVLDKIIGNIYSAIGRENGFENVVKRYIDNAVNIPDNFKATCSIGVSSGENISSDIQIYELLKKADSALYDVKYTGRGYAKFI